jgi:hypothetical protein
VERLFNPSLLEQFEADVSQSLVGELISVTQEFDETVGIAEGLCNRVGTFADDPGTEVDEGVIAHATCGDESGAPDPPIVEPFDLPVELAVEAFKLVVLEFAEYASEALGVRGRRSRITAVACLVEDLEEPRLVHFKNASGGDGSPSWRDSAGRHTFRR